MVNNNINMTGYISYNGKQYFCTVNDYRVKMLYKDEKDKPSLYGLKCNKEEEFLFGVDENDAGFAVRMSKHPKEGEFFQNVAFEFYTPMFIKSTYSNGCDSFCFDCIEFYGETVNKVLDPRNAVDYGKLESEKLEDMRLKLKPYNDYKQEYTSELFGEKIQVITTVYSYFSLAEQKNEDRSISLGSLNSTVRFVFDSRKTLKEMEGYWRIFNLLLIFLTGRRNVDFGVKLFQRDETYQLSHKADCYFRRREKDVYNDRLQKTLQLTAIGDKLPNLLTLFANEHLQEVFRFLPENNEFANTITYSDVLDICTAFEIIYTLSGLKAPADDIAKDLCEALKKTIKEFKSEMPDKKKKDRVFDVAFGSIKHIKTPLKEKISYLYETSLKKSDTPEEKAIQIKNAIEEFVNLRDKITHQGSVDWQNNGLFSVTLKKILYVHVLLLAKIEKEIAVKMAEQKWGN